MARPHYKRTPAEPARQEAEVPVMLPHVVIDVTAEGTMTVTVDGHPAEPEPFAPPWGREDFATILDQLTDQHRSPVRVEVREADGTTFTDIITPGKPRRPEPDPAPETPARKLPELAVLHGEGFVPGEDVAVAVIIAHSEATGDGSVRGVLTSAQLAASPTREVILLGRVSGALTVGHPA